MSLPVYPLLEYTLPGCRKRNDIAANIDTAKFEIWANEVLLFCEEEMLRQIAEKEEGGPEGNLEDKETHLREKARLEAELVSLRVRLSTFLVELEDNNTQRTKIYHHFPHTKYPNRRR
ncbi:hypothetical protein PM082_022788 [Marasmius tenuissimus]|nr:hypothetical protein PM082_022788 [Marasmius tenuissimus]